MKTNPKCPKCDTQMEIGNLIDHGHMHSELPTSWKSEDTVPQKQTLLGSMQKVCPNRKLLDVSLLAGRLSKESLPVIQH